MLLKTYSHKSFIQLLDSLAARSGGMKSENLLSNFETLQKQFSFSKSFFFSVHVSPRNDYTFNEIIKISEPPGSYEYIYGEIKIQKCS